MPFVRIKPNLLNIKCLEWAPAHFQKFENCTQALKNISRNAGTTSDVFEQAVKKFTYLAVLKI